MADTVGSRRHTSDARANDGNFESFQLRIRARRVWGMNRVLNQLEQMERIEERIFHAWLDPHVLGPISRLGGTNHDQTASDNTHNKHYTDRMASPFIYNTTVGTQTRESTRPGADTLGGEVCLGTCGTRGRPE